MNYYTNIDTIFEKLYEKYGYDEILVLSKDKLVEYYENENKYKSLYICDKIKSKNFIINEEGNINEIKI